VGGFGFGLTGTARDAHARVPFVQGGVIAAMFKLRIPWMSHLPERGRATVGWRGAPVEAAWLSIGRF